MKNNEKFNEAYKYSMKIGKKTKNTIKLKKIKVIFLDSIPGLKSHSSPLVDTFLNSVVKERILQFEFIFELQIVMFVIRKYSKLSWR